MNLFIPTDRNKRYHTLDYEYRHLFGTKVFKISLNAGFTCPNIDGKTGIGGCIYCSVSGSGDFAGRQEDDLVTQFESVKQIIHQKWKKASYIGYFQAHTNTYAPLAVLKNCYETILKQDHVVGLAIATRPDAISPEVMDYLEELSKRTYLTVELGLQSIHETTAKFINRGHTLSCFEACLTELRKRQIPVVVHIINGLPGETKEMMLETVTYLNYLDLQGIKIHMLHVLKQTKLGFLYEEKPFPILRKEDYITLVCDQLECLRPEIVIHRVTGDPNPEDLIAPTWLLKKFDVLNGIDQELEKRKTFQGFRLTIDHAITRSIALALRPTERALNLSSYPNSLFAVVPNLSLTSILEEEKKGTYSLILSEDFSHEAIEKLLSYLHPTGTLLILGEKEILEAFHLGTVTTSLSKEEPSLLEIRKKR